MEQTFLGKSQKEYSRLKRMKGDFLVKEGVLRVGLKDSQNSYLFLKTFVFLGLLG